MTSKSKVGEKQIIVTCDNCKDLLAYSGEMTQEEAEIKKSRLTINPFGAPRCDKCNNEPYSDINLMHTIEIVDFDPKRTLNP